MTQSELNKKSSDLLLSNHVTWLHNPVTVETKKIIDERIDKIVNAIADASLNKDLPDTFVRHYAAQLRILKTIKKDLYDSESFIARTQSN